jgi:hypothetical protein
MNHHIIFQIDSLIQGLRDLRTELEHHGVGSSLVTKQDLKESESRIMSAVTDWAAKEQANLDAISGTLDGIVTGIAALDAKIVALNASPGALSAADQAALDAIQAASAALVTKSAAISTTSP